MKEILFWIWLASMVILMIFALITIDRERLHRARGSALDQLGYVWNLKRKRWWIFKESDASYRRRLDENARKLPPTIVARREFYDARKKPR